MKHPRCHCYIIENAGRLEWHISHCLENHQSTELTSAILVAFTFQLIMWKWTHGLALGTWFYTIRNEFPFNSQSVFIVSFIMFGLWFTTFSRVDGKSTYPSKNPSKQSTYDIGYTYIFYSYLIVSLSIILR